MAITIVTAFFDIGRGNWSGYINAHPLPSYLKRSTDEYFKNFERLLRLDNDIIVFTSEDLRERFRPYEEQKSNLIVNYIEDWILIHSDIRKSVDRIQGSSKFQHMVKQPWNPEYWNDSYVMVNFLKSFFVVSAIETLEQVKTDFVSWIDFGYIREDYMVPTNSWDYDFSPNVMHLFSIYPELPLQHEIDIKDIVKNNDVYIQGCHIVGHKDLWMVHMKLMDKQMESLIDMNLVDDDQSLLLLSYFTHPESYQIHYVDTTKIGNWFQIFMNWNNKNV